MLETIKQIVSMQSQIPIESLYEDANFVELGMDSLTLLKIIIEIENEFSVHFEDEEIVEIRTVLDITNLVIRKLN